MSSLVVNSNVAIFQFRLNHYSGLFVGVYREENLIKKDTIIAQINCYPGREPGKQYLGIRRAGVKKGNYYTVNCGGDKKWDFNWFDITKETGITASGDVTIHPRAIELPLKNIFDANKWW